MIPPTLQDSFTVGISNSWQQTDSVAKAWIPSECCARFDQFSADCHRQSLMLRRRRLVLISSSIPTQLPPEAPVRKCGRRGWSMRRQPLYSCTVVMLMLVLSLSLSSRLSEEGCFSPLTAATSFSEGLIHGCGNLWRFVPVRVVPASTSRWNCRRVIGGLMTIWYDHENGFMFYLSCSPREKHNWKGHAC